MKIYSLLLCCFLFFQSDTLSAYHIQSYPFFGGGIFVIAGSMVYGNEARKAYLEVCTSKKSLARRSSNKIKNSRQKIFAQIPQAIDCHRATIGWGTASISFAIIGAWLLSKGFASN